MNFIKKAAAVFFAFFIIFGVSAFPVLAMETEEQQINMEEIQTQMENEGLEVTVLFDKEVYEEGEPITAKIIVKNISGETAIIRDVEQLVPEGYVLSENLPEYEEDFLLEPDGTIELEVTYGEVIENPEEEGAEAFFDKVIFGETLGIPNILIAVLLVIAVALFYYFT